MKLENKKRMWIVLSVVVLAAIGILVREVMGSQQSLEDNKEIAENTNGFHIETLSDKKTIVQHTTRVYVMMFLRSKLNW